LTGGIGKTHEMLKERGWWGEW